MVARRAEAGGDASYSARVRRRPEARVDRIRMHAVASRRGHDRYAGSWWQQGAGAGHMHAKPSVLFPSNPEI